MGKKEEVLKEQKHILERLLLNPKIQRAAGWLSRPVKGGETLFERLMFSFDNPDAPLHDRVLFYPLHAVFEHMLEQHDADLDMVKFKLFQHRPTLRALVNTARSTCGGCRARADAYTGDILGGDPGCVNNRELWEKFNFDEDAARLVDQTL